MKSHDIRIILDHFFEEKKRLPPLLRWALVVTLVVLIGCALVGTQEVRAEEPSTQALQASDNKILPIGRVWAGVRVNFDAIASENAIFVAYYDADRWLTVARVDLKTKNVVKKRLESRFGGWDSHNSIELAIDSSGYLHVAGNMHGVPLVYARTLKPGDFASLTLVNKMVGTEEKTVTYPRFFPLPDGTLGFSYRSGGSGSGQEFINRFDGSKWVRWLNTPLFSYDSAAEHVNAYHDDYVRGPDNAYYIAWVWRKTSLVETNFNVCFAKSYDLKTWYDSRERIIALPITPSKAEVVDKIGPGQGLFNNIKMGFDLSGQPIISYLKYDAAGNSQLYHARLEKEGWMITCATDWDYRWDFKGAGTIVSEISFSGVTPHEGTLQEVVRHPKGGTSTYLYDLETLRFAKILPKPPATSPPRSGRKASRPFIAATRAVKTAGGQNNQLYTIDWAALPANNRDQPRSCEASGLPSGCQFVSDLYLAFQ